MITVAGITHFGMFHLRQSGIEGNSAVGRKREAFSAGIPTFHWTSYLVLGKFSLRECETMTSKKTHNLSIHSRENHRPNIISWLAA
jgi:hypothetical protein